MRNTRKLGLMNCPVKTGAAQVNATGQEMARAMRRLRRDMETCRRCEQMPDCPVLAKIKVQIREAILEVNRLWGMGEA